MVLTTPTPAGGNRRIHYEPHDPTPAAGGPSLNPPAGPQDQTAVERRHDVLVHTSSPLEHDLEVVGTTSMRLRASTVDLSALVVVRLCDVDPVGVSRNVTEGLARLRPDQPGEPRLTQIALDPTAHVFRAGHRLRVQVAAGAHPRVVDTRGAAYTIVVRYGDPDRPTLTLPTARHE